MSAIGRNVRMISGLVGISLLGLAGPTACSDAKTGPGSTIHEQPSTFGGQATGGSAAVPTAGTLASPGDQAPLDLPGSTGGTGNTSTAGQGGVGGGCAATFVQAELKTLAMFVMLDQSQSMDRIVNEADGTTRWDAVTSAFEGFVRSPATADFPVGLQYFGLPETNAGGGGSGGSGGGTGGRGPQFPRMDVSCNVNDYAVPEVPIAPLAMNAQAIIDSMAAHGPLTSTPTLPAIQGGIAFATKYAQENPDYKVVLVLATDGAPSGCQSTIENVTAAAATGLSGNPSIQTYVIGVGDNLMNLNAIAAAGGTERAFLVSDSNVQQDLLTALTAIRGSQVPCEYSVPVAAAGQDLDFGKVNVQYTPKTGAPQVLQKVETAADCPASGSFWYYDDNAAPKQILLCQDTCQTLTSTGDGKVEIVLDCKETIVKPPT